MTKEENISVFTLFTTYLGYAVLVLFGHLRDFMGWLTGRSRYHQELSTSGNLVSGWERFYTRRMFDRIQDCWSRPVTSRPSAWITIASRCKMDRGMQIEWKKESQKRVLNLGSYNYLGFADDDWDKTCGEVVFTSMKNFGVSISYDSIQINETKCLEEEIASFVGMEDAVLLGTGYATNAWTLSKLVGPGCLIVSDSLNHTSIVNGCRASGARVVPFEHNNAKDLEMIIGKELIQNPTVKKVLVVVEGLYSMEGQICKLKPILQVCKRMKCFLYVDEAHSIGALGANGKGICELSQVNPRDVDILMGTFTKSFGGLGGYIAGSKSLCTWLRMQMIKDPRSSKMSPVVLSQIRRALFLLRETELGKKKLVSLRENALFFRRELKRMGCTVLGDDDSPIIPVMLYHPAKIAAFSRECLASGLAVVVVGAPAVPLMGARARFCISASHSKQDLIWALREIRKVCQKLNLRYEKSTFG